MYTSIKLYTGNTITAGQPVGVTLNKTQGILEKGVKYSLQFKVINYTTNNTLNYVYVGSQKLSNVDISQGTVVETVNGKDVRLCVVEFTASSKMTNPVIKIGRNMVAGDATNTLLYELTDFQLERGYKTDYSPNSNDLQSVKTSLESKINQLADSLQFYVAKNDFDNLGNNVSSALGQIEVTTEAISLKVEKTDIDNAINKIEVGNRNLLLNTGTKKTFVGKNTENQCSALYSFELKNKQNIKQSNVAIRFKYSVSQGATGTFRIQTNGAYSTDNGETSGEWVGLSGTINVTNKPSGVISKLYTFNVPEHKGFNGLQIRMDDFVGEVTIEECMLVEGGVLLSDWSPCPKDVEDSIDTKVNTAKAEIKVTTDAISQSVSNLNTTVSKKADGSTVTTLSNKVGTLETSVNGISGRVSSVETANTTMTQNITKAQQDATKGINDAKSANDKATSAQSTANNNKASIGTLTTEVSNVKSNVATLDVDLNKITQRVASTETNIQTTTTKLDNLQVGGRNYALNSDEEKTISSSYATYNISPEAKTELQGKEVTVSFYAKKSSGTANLYTYLRSSGGAIQPTSDKYGDITTEYKKYAITFVAPSNLSSAVTVAVHTTNNVGLSVKYLKLEQGNKATDWTPAIEDVDASIASVDSKVQTTNNKVASIETNLNGITQRVSSTESTVSSHTTQLGTVDTRINNAKNSAISTASSDATTKANNALASAKTDATTKANNALADAKTYTNGQITTVNTTINNKVAEIKATTDAITQRVSSTESNLTTTTATANSALNNTNNMWTKNYSVNTSTILPIKEFDGESNLNAKYWYEVEGFIDGTSTNNGTLVVFKGDGTSFTREVIFEKGTSSNHPKLFLEDGVPSVSIYNHSSKYNVICRVKRVPRTNSTVSSLQATTSKVAEITTSLDSITQRIESTESSTSTLTEQVKVTVKDVKVYYAINTSSSSAPTSGWSTTPPTWENGKYIWSKTTTTLTNGNSTTTNPVCITGAKGATGATGQTGAKGDKGDKGDTGATGASGKGVKSITNYYLATTSSSGVTTSTSGWTTTVQSVSSSKKYLWNYEKVTYTDNTSTSTTPCVIGAYGDTGATGAKGDKGDTGSQGAKGDKGATGATGKGIKSIVEYYAVSSSNTTAPTSWSTTVQNTTTTNKYLWNYEVITYTDNSTTSTPKKVIGTHGATGAKGDTGATGQKGDTGATGTGIQSVTTEYYLSTSKTTQTGGSWVTTQPTWSNGKYLWTRSKIVYKNPTSTAYTTPVCDSSWEAVNEVKPQIESNTSQITTTKNKVATIETNLSSITSRVSSTESSVSTIKGNVSSLQTRVNTAEQKITDSAIVSTVTNSQTYKNGLNGKVSTNQVISSINQTAEAIKISANKLDLTGQLDLQGRFKCWKSNSDKTGNYLHMDGAMMYGYNKTGGSKPVFASGLWTDENMGYFSVGYTNALTTDANGCLWMSPQHGNAGCRLTFSRLVNSSMLSTNLYFQKDGAIDFSTSLRGANDTDDVYTYRFDSGVSTKSLRCDNLRTYRITPRSSGSYDIGRPTMRYRDIFADSMSTTNNQLRLGTIKSDGSWQTYGALDINSSTGYIFPHKGNGQLSLGTNGNRFHGIYLVNSPNVSSDERVKTDIHYLDEPMPEEPTILDGRVERNMKLTTKDMYDFIKDDLKLASYRYNLNLERGNTATDYGFIAQDILYTKVGSELIQLEDKEDLNSTLSYNQGNYISTIVGALQEAINKIEVLEKKVQELESKLV